MNELTTDILKVLKSWGNEWHGYEELKKEVGKPMVHIKKIMNELVLTGYVVKKQKYNESGTVNGSGFFLISNILGIGSDYKYLKNPSQVAKVVDIENNQICLKLFDQNRKFIAYSSCLGHKFFTLYVAI